MTTLPKIVFSIIFCFTFTEAIKVKECRTLYNILHTEITYFNDCVIKNYEPTESVSYCIDCSVDYYKMVDAYDDLINKIVTINDQIIPCKSLYFGLDSVNAMENIYLNAVQIWNIAECSNCFDKNRHKVKEVTDFEFKLGALHRCIDQAIGNHMNVCVECNDEYHNLTSNYDSVYHLCFDKSNVLNKTKHEWSNRYKCASDKPEDKTDFILGSVSVIGTVILLFFAGFFIRKARTPSHEVLPNADSEDPRSDDRQTDNTPTNSKRSEKYVNFVDDSSDDSDDEMLKCEGAAQRKLDSNIAPNDMPSVSNVNTDSINEKVIKKLSKMDSTDNDDDDELLNLKNTKILKKTKQRKDHGDKDDDDDDELIS